MNEKTLTDKIIDFLFEKKDFVYLSIIVLLGAILRAIIAINTGPSADEAVYATHAIDIIKSGMISNQNQSIVWFYLADIFYNILGVTLFASKFTSFLFGTLTIIATYLLAKEISKNKKIALLAAFLYAFSPYAVRFMLMEMDPTPTFFIAFAAYFFIKDIKQNKVSVMAFLVVGIGIMTKAISLMFIPGFGLVYLVYLLLLKDKKEFYNKKNIKRLLISVLILVIIVMPILTYNYLLYKEKGLTDVMFFRFMGIKNEMFEPIANTLKPFKLVGEEGVFPAGIKATSVFFSSWDPVLFILFLLALTFVIIKKNRLAIYLIAAYIPAWIFTSGTSLLPNHFLFYLPLFAVISSLFVWDILNNKKIEKYKKNILRLFILIFLIYCIIMLWPNLLSESAVGKMRDYTNRNIDTNSLVVADARIYRGQIAWMFNDKHYIEASLLDQAVASTSNIPEQPIPIKTYFIECAIDDCGWGTITAGPLNDSMEFMTGKFANISKIITIKGGGGYGEKEGMPHFNVYETSLVLKPSLLNAVEQTHVFFYYPVRWELKEQIYDSLNPQTLFDRGLHSLAYLIVWLDVIAAFLLSIFAVYLGYKEAINE